MLITIASLSEFKSGRQNLGDLLELLPDSSRNRILKITNEDSFGRSVLGELLIRYSLAELAGTKLENNEFTLSPKGKPSLPNDHGLHFNMSHSADRIAVAVGNSEVGIDVEQTRRVNFRVAERFFSAPEINDLMALPEEERQEYFFTLWTIKESFLKAIGSGLTRSLNTFTVERSLFGFSLTGGEPASKYFVHTYKPCDQYQLAVCSLGNDFPSDIVEVKGDIILDKLAQ